MKYFAGRQHGKGNLLSRFHGNTQQFSNAESNVCLKIQKQRFAALSQNFQYLLRVSRKKSLLMISGFRRDVDEICALLDITQRRVVTLHLGFGTTHRSHFQGSRLSRNVVKGLPLDAA
jgi:hypothetical protein